MSRNDEKPFAAIRELYPETSGFWRIRTCPPVDDARETVYALGPDGQVRALLTPADRNAAARRGERLFAVAKETMRFGMVVTGVCKEDGYRWNYVLEGILAVGDPAAFVRAWGEKEGCCGIDGVPSDLIEAKVGLEIESIVRDQIGECRKLRNYRVAEIEESDALPAPFWTNVIGRADVLGGLRLEVLEKGFVSPDKELEERQIRAAEAEREMQERMRAETRKLVDRQAAQAEIDELVRARERAQDRFRLEREQLQERIRQMKRESNLHAMVELEKAKLEIEKARNDEEIRKALALKQGEREGDLAMAASLKEAADKLAKVMSALSALGVSADEARRLAPTIKVDPVVAPKYSGMSDSFREVMAGIGRLADNAITISWEIFSGEGRYATRDMVPARSRDDVKIVSGKLHLGDRMTLRLRSGRAGYLTLFNLGTSGTVSKVFPCAAFGTTQNYIEANRVYSLPGELMSEENLPDGLWVETGPASSRNGLPERVVAVLTDEPVELGEDCFGDVCKYATRGGFEVIEESISSVEDLRPGSWCFGLVEAWVEE